MKEMTIQILIQSSIFIILLVLNYIFTSYFRQKGKNLADKEDIQQLTKLVEEVKSSFLHETEHLRANLNLITSIETSIQSEERNAIIELIKCCTELINLCFIPARLIREDKLIELEEHRRQLDIGFSELLVKESMFDLFITDAELHRLKKKLITNIITNQYTASYNFIVEIINILTAIQNKVDRSKIGEDYNQYVEKYRDFCNKNTAFYKETESIRNPFYYNCKLFLKSSIEDLQGVTSGKEMGKKIAETKET
ncbi:MAG: hypothetical protein Q7U88_00085 [Desulfocapsaceae bacterium]|nr:hypothetical protein [Desulfocapsaceae bacterium]